MRQLTQYIIILLLISLVGLEVSNHFNSIKYFEGSTFIAVFRSNNKLHDRVQYNQNGFEDKKSVFCWIESQRNNIEQENGPAVLILFDVIKSDQ